MPNEITVEQIEQFKIPQFFYKVSDTLFTEGCYEFLEKETLSEGFTLKGKSYDIDFSSTDSEMVWVDIKENEGSTPKVFKMSNADQQYFKEYFSKLPPKARVEKCKDIMHHQLNKLDLVDSTELYRYSDNLREGAIKMSHFIDILEKL